MNAELALKSEVADKLGGAPERFVLAEVDPYRIDRRLEPRGTRFHHDGGAGVVELALLEGPPHSHVEGVVAGSEREPPHPGAGAGDIAKLHHAAAGLDDRHEIDAAFAKAPRALQRRDGPVDSHELGGRLDLRQDDAVDALRDHRLQIVEAERGVERVDPHVPEGAARRLERRDHFLARGRLLRDGDRILEIENDDIGVESQRFLDASGVVARREQQ